MKGQMATDAAESEPRACLFTDIVDFMSYMAEDEEGTLRLRDRSVAVIRRLVEAHGGELLGAAGDGSCSAFEGVEEALRCGLAIQQEPRGGEDLGLRVAIHLCRGTNWGHEDVRAGDALAGSCRGGGLRVSAVAFEKLPEGLELRVTDLGPVALRGTEQPLAAHEVETGAELPAPRESREAPAERRLAAVLLADVVSYSALMAKHEDSTMRELKRYRGLFRFAVRELGGRVVDTSGDGVLAEFSSALAATRCALLVQQNLHERNAELLPDRAVRYRIGIHLGDVRVEGDRIYGSGVNIAARLEALAPTGGVCISGPVYEQVRYRLDREFQDLGEQSLKNIPYPVHAYAISLDGAPVATRRASRGARWIALAAALLLLGGVAVWLGLRS